MRGRRVARRKADPSTTSRKSRGSLVGMTIETRNQKSETGKCRGENFRRMEIGKSEVEIRRERVPARKPGVWGTRLREHRFDTLGVRTEVRRDASTVGSAGPSVTGQVEDP